MQAVIKVWHKDAYKIVGKVFSYGGKLIFLHEESGSQGHDKLSSPGGVDEVVLHQLAVWGVGEMHHYDRQRRRHYVTKLDHFYPPTRAAIRQKSGGRTRWYLPEQYWAWPGNTLPFKPPWVEDVVELGGPGGPKVNQLSLFGE